MTGPIASLRPTGLAAQQTMGNHKSSTFWDPYLQENEQILREGRTFPGITLSNTKILSLFVIPAMIWGAFIAPSDLPHTPLLPIGSNVWIAFVLAIFAFIWTEDLIRLAFTRYAFSQRRCINSTNFFARKTLNYPIELAKLQDPKVGSLANIQFAEDACGSDKGLQTHPIGFLRSRRAQNVYRHRVRLQQAAE